ncbi:hypothetical protein AVEN_96862-1 [Araneus ventricosus]|uniref:Uncharacterized protein n=1 Tax=Araneus ventricosus TaxID=182803 RepID=A0A4Y2VVL7_ARAVE|nr:hypothetical protein AVEN_96862-1 [Araneus ventricosus]
MKRQASIQNFFAKKQSVNRPVSDSVEVDCASNNVSSGVANTSTVDPAPVVENFNQKKNQVTQHLRHIDTSVQLRIPVFFFCAVRDVVAGLFGRRQTLESLL